MAYLDLINYQIIFINMEIFFKKLAKMYPFIW